MLVTERSAAGEWGWDGRWPGEGASVLILLHAEGSGLNGHLDGRVGRSLVVLALHVVCRVELHVASSFSLVRGVVRRKLWEGAEGVNKTARQDRACECKRCRVWCLGSLMASHPLKQGKVD